MSPSIKGMVPANQVRFIEKLGVPQRIGMLHTAVTYKVVDQRFTLIHFVGEFKGHSKKLRAAWSRL